MEPSLPLLPFRPRTLHMDSSCVYWLRPPCPPQVLQSVVPFLNDAEKRDLMEQYLARTFCASFRRWAAEVRAASGGMCCIYAGFTLAWEKQCDV